MPRLFISSYFGNAAMIESIIVPVAQARGFEIVSTWHRHAKGPEMLDRKTDAQIDAINATNDADLAAADCVLVITHEKSAQTYCELARAVVFGKLVAVNTCARDLPEAHRPGVKRFTSSTDALTWLSYESSARFVFEPMPDTQPGEDEDVLERLMTGTEP